MAKEVFYNLGIGNGLLLSSILVLMTLCFRYISFSKERFFWNVGLQNHYFGVLNKSSNGWTTDEIGIDWLQTHFLSNLPKRKGKYILLILDGYSSYLTPEFDQICKENNIISLCMPAHASYLLQFFD